MKYVRKEVAVNIKDWVPHVRKSANIERRPVTFWIAPLRREINRLFDDFWSGWGRPALIREV
jgi:hypothetical protein